MGSCAIPAESEDSVRDTGVGHLLTLSVLPLPEA